MLYNVIGPSIYILELHSKNVDKRSYTNIYGYLCVLDMTIFISLISTE